MTKPLELLDSCHFGEMGADLMTGLFVALLFGSALVAAVWTLFVSIRPQIHRFAELTRPVTQLAALPPRLSRVTARTVPARMPAPVRRQQRAAA